MGCALTKNDVAPAAAVTKAAPERSGSAKSKTSGAWRNGSKDEIHEQGLPDLVGKKPSNGDKQDKHKDLLVCGKYRMGLDKSDIMGEGSFSVCRRGTHVETGEQVAIKVYKSSGNDASKKQVCLQKFTRQIHVLKELMEPLKEPADKVLWHADMDSAKSARLFIQLIDYTQDEKGEPAPGEDGQMYVVTELAQYSLKDYLAQRRKQEKPLPRDLVRKITKSIVHVMAGLHAKGLVHLDLKPENLMMFKGRLKLIDVDGCVRINSSVSIHDSTISFSPCYCAPEWAKFLIEDSETQARICIRPALDVWSAGMAICELVTLDAVLKPTYAKFLRSASSHREAGFLFMDYLSSIKKAPIPKKIVEFDSEFADFLTSFLLVCDPAKRRSFAEAMESTYLKVLSDEDKLLKGRSDSKSTTIMDSHHRGLDDIERTIRSKASRNKDMQSRAPLHKGTLWILNAGGNAQDGTHWQKRDMWIAMHGELCYFDTTSRKRMVLIDTAKIVQACVSKFDGGAKEIAFQINTRSEHEDDRDDVKVFACDTHEEFEVWQSKLQEAAHLELPTIQLGEDFAKEFAGFKLTVKNRRMQVDGNEKDQFAPAFKAKLWKVKAEGDRMKEQDWFEREMWIAKNGSLVYWSKKENRDLVYYTADDIAGASFTRIDSTESFQPWAFQVHLPIVNGVEFAPGEFAAESEEMRDRWLHELGSYRKRPPEEDTPAAGLPPGSGLPCPSA